MSTIALEAQKDIDDGMTFEVFDESWQQEKVDDSLLKFYGTWPDAQVIAPIFRP